MKCKPVGDGDTFTLIARCEKTGIMGVGMITSAIAVGSRCPFGLARVGVGSVQAFPDPRLRNLASRLLQMGYSAEKVLEELVSSDPYNDYRQIGIVDKDNNAAAYTGAKNSPWSGHIVNNGFIAMGNYLAGERTITAMANAYEASANELLEERILQALEAGVGAGGQCDENGKPFGFLCSGAMLSFEWDTFPRVDLRVDHHPKPALELRRLWEVYEPLRPYFAKRASDPTIGSTYEAVHKYAKKGFIDCYYFKTDKS